MGGTERIGRPVRSGKRVWPDILPAADGTSVAPQRRAPVGHVRRKLRQVPLAESNAAGQADAVGRCDTRPCTATGGDLSGQWPCIAVAESSPAN